MSDIVNPIQSISYTNKDFESVYVELLDIVKKLTYKWDPTISNESDPGVILLKLNAIIADKCNYNIDKNVLECFPLSVTQTGNARQLFEQLGYRMKWYRSATSDISVSFIDNEYIDNSFIFDIPVFTMISDDDNSIIYTLTGVKDATGKLDINVGNISLPANGSTITCNAIQGVATAYSINGQNIITTANLDSNNRLYFNMTDIAENGIFICNYGQNNYNDWIRKDNLLIEELGNSFYKFGVSQDGFSCYVEFPEDAEILFKDGICITYIVSDGSFGNTTARNLTKFYSDLSVLGASGERELLNTSNVEICNYSSIANGEDPENINDGYRSYKKTVGTFDTLVTLRDYLNYIVNNNLGSNGFVTDRTNDIQLTYDIMAKINGLDQPVLQVEPYEEKLDSFNLKFYIFNYVDGVDNLYRYKNSYELMTEDKLSSVREYLDDSKSLQHNYSKILPTVGLGTPAWNINNVYNKGDRVAYRHKIYKAKFKIVKGTDWSADNWEEDTQRFSHYCLFKNKYSVEGQITPQYELTLSQKNDLINNVIKKLYEELNSQKMEFGDEISSELIIDTINNSDERIKKFLLLKNIEYNTYAVYWDGYYFREAVLNGSNYFPVDLSYIKNSSSYAENPYNRYYDNDDKLYKWEFDSGRKISVNYDIGTENTFLSKVELDDYVIRDFTYSSNNKWVCEDSSDDISKYGVTIEGTYNIGDVITLGFSVGYQFNNEIYTKSVLAGKTQFFIDDNDYAFALNNNKYISSPGSTIDPVIQEDIIRIEPSVEITIDSNGEPENDMQFYELKDNENIQLYSPNLINLESYSNYVKYECKLNNNKQILLDTNYELRNGEYIIFYWKEQDEDELYKYYYYGEGNTIYSTFSLRTTSTSKGVEKIISRERNVGTEDEPRYIADTVYSGTIPEEVSKDVTNIADTIQILSGSKKISLKKRNSIELYSGYYKCFWVLNNSINDKYVLFDYNENKYTLNSGEYFFYSNMSLSNFVILGAGTTIERNDNNLNRLECDIVNLSDVLNVGMDILSNSWVNIPTGTSIKITENTIVSIGAGSKLYLKPDGWAGYWSVKFTKDGTIIDTPTGSEVLNNFIIKYLAQGADSITSLPSIDADKYGWDARSILNVVCSKDDPQYLLENQTLEYYVKDDYELDDDLNPKKDEHGNLIYKTHKLTGMSRTGTGDYPVAILSSIGINSNGAYKFDTFYDNPDGSTTYLALYKYMKCESTSTVVYTEDGGVALYFKPDQIDEVSSKIKFDSILVGDINKDEAITIDDFNLLRSHVSGESEITDQMALLAADVNTDGHINSSDIELLNGIINNANRPKYKYVTIADAEGFKSGQTPYIEGIDFEFAICYLDDLVTIYSNSKLIKNTNITVTNKVRYFDFCIPDGKYVLGFKNNYNYLTTAGSYIKIDGEDMHLVNSPDTHVDFDKSSSWLLDLILTSESREAQISTTSRLIGDVNNDGIINSTDSMQVQMHIDGSRPITDRLSLLAADVDMNSIIDIDDANNILDIAAGLYQPAYRYVTYAEVPDLKISSSFKIEGLSCNYLATCRDSGIAIIYSNEIINSGTVINVNLGSSTHRITMSINGYENQGDTIMVFNKPYKYTMPTYPKKMTEEKFNLILKLLKYFDVDNKYDYSYVIDKYSEIPNPTDAETFMYSTHIYNKNTISQLDTSRLDIVISGRK